MNLQFLQVLNIVDQSFDSFQTGRYRLSVRIAADSFTFCLSDPDRNMYIQLASFVNPAYKGVRRLDKEVVEEMFEKIAAIHPWINGRFAAVNILFEDCRFTLLPLSLFNSANYKAIYEFNFLNTFGEEVLFQTLTIADLAIMYGIPAGLAEFLQYKYPFARYHHSNFSLMNVFLNKYRNSENPGIVLANFRNGAIDLIIVENRKLKLLNSYTCQADDDVLYFLVMAIEQMGLNPETADVYLCGDIEKDDKLHLKIQKYIRNVRLMNRNDDFRYCYAFEKIESHRFYNLLNLNLCE
jgi:hypothetical protein